MTHGVVFLKWSKTEQILLQISNTNKCVFCQEMVQYLEFTIGKDGLHLSKDKIEAIVKIKVPENTNNVNAFLGIVNYLFQI